MSERLFVGARRVDALPPGDRGRAYGDGLFETMRVHQGRVPWWEEHWTRLSSGARRLGIPMPDQALACAEATGLFADGGDGVLKLILSRGGVGRGYAPPAGEAPVWSLSRHALPASPPAEGVVLRWCRTPLAVQPALAGMKHCNRLEQVLARAEWSEGEAAADEGLMCDTDGLVVCATSANLFMLEGGRWKTPRIDRCGVAGICRAWVMSAAVVEETEVSRDRLDAADAVFLCNAVRGILPVARVGERAWPPHPALRMLQRRLGAAHPAFVVPMEDA